MSATPPRMNEDLLGGKLFSMYYEQVLVFVKSSFTFLFNLLH